MDIEYPFKIEASTTSQGTEKTSMIVYGNPIPVYVELVLHYVQHVTETTLYKVEALLFDFDFIYFS